MNKKILCAALLGGLSLANTAMAQEFDDRWYLTGSAGWNQQDSDRRTEDTQFLTLGLGKFISPNWSLDGELNYQNPNFNKNQDLNWSQYGASLDLRRHFIQEGRGWNPYLLFGLGYQKAEEEYPILSPNSPAQREDGNLAAKIGAGLQTTFDKRVAVRLRRPEHGRSAGRLVRRRAGFGRRRDPAGPGRCCRCPGSGSHPGCAELRGPGRRR